MPSTYFGKFLSETSFQWFKPFVFWTFGTHISWCYETVIIPLPPALSHTYSHTLSFSLPIILSLSLSYSHYISLSYALTLTISLYLTLYLFLRVTIFFTLLPSNTDYLTLSLSHSPQFSHPAPNKTSLSSWSHSKTCETKNIFFGRNFFGLYFQNAKVKFSLVRSASNRNIPIWKIGT